MLRREYRHSSNTHNVKCIWEKKCWTRAKIVKSWNDFDPRHEIILLYEWKRCLRKHKKGNYVCEEGMDCTQGIYIEIYCVICSLFIHQTKFPWLDQRLT